MALPADRGQAPPYRMRACRGHIGGTQKLAIEQEVFGRSPALGCTPEEGHLSGVRLTEKIALVEVDPAQLAALDELQSDLGGEAVHIGEIALHHLHPEVHGAVFENGLMCRQ